MTQTWHDLLFAHWAIPGGDLRRLVPQSIELDLYEGQGWIGVVPFRMTGIRRRGVFALPGLSAFLELNVRTYVTLGGRPGVYFFSLDAANNLAVAIARRWFHLPYFHARMSLDQAGGLCRYSSRRKAAPAEFRARYRPTGDVFLARPGTLEHWLTERYCLYAVDSQGRVYRGEIHHRPWPLQPAQAEIDVNTMTAPLGLALPAAEPLLHFSRRLEVLIWSPERLSHRQ